MQHKEVLPDHTGAAAAALLLVVHALFAVLPCVFVLDTGGLLLAWQCLFWKKKRKMNKHKHEKIKKNK